MEAKLSVHQQMNGQRCGIYTCVYTHTHTGILFSHEKEWNFAICSNMDRRGGHYAELNKLEKHKRCMLSLICGT